MGTVSSPERAELALEGPMPELPEVETIVRGLASVLPGRTIQAVRILDPKLAAGLSISPSRLAGRTFVSVSRFGKYIRFALDDGSSLVAHLRMTGKFVYSPDVAPPGGRPAERHLRLEVSFSDGSRLFFRDMRRFGTIRHVPAGETPAEMQATAPDPLSPGMDDARFAGMLAGSRQAVKILLLDQHRISGIGNIYACESLFRAKIDPARGGNTLSLAESRRLLREVRAILREAIRHNGTTISDFRSVDDKTGDFQNWLRVYDRTGQPCRGCGTPIVRIRQGQRSTWFCPHCQH